jgi:hypothetical protein
MTVGSGCVRLCLLCLLLWLLWLLWLLLAAATLIQAGSWMAKKGFVPVPKPPIGSSLLHCSLVPLCCIVFHSASASVAGAGVLAAYGVLRAMSTVLESIHSLPELYQQVRCACYAPAVPAVPAVPVARLLQVRCPHSVSALLLFPWPC